MSFSDFLEKKILDHINQVAVYTATAKYMALYTSNPGEDNSGTEVSDTVDDLAYARQPISFAATTLGSGTSLSSNVQTFAPVDYGSGGAAYTVTHIGIFNALTGGDLLEYTPLGASISRLTGKTLVFDAGAVSVTLD
jgi:hypothetical protein